MYSCDRLRSNDAYVNLNGKSFCLYISLDWDYFDWVFRYFCTTTNPPTQPPKKYNLRHTSFKYKLTLTKTVILTLIKSLLPAVCLFMGILMPEDRYMIVYIRAQRGRHFACHRDLLTVVFVVCTHIHSSQLLQVYKLTEFLQNIPNCKIALPRSSDNLVHGQAIWLILKNISTHALKQLINFKWGY